MKILLNKKDAEYIKEKTGVDIGDGLSFTADVEFCLDGVGLYLIDLQINCVEIMLDGGET